MNRTVAVLLSALVLTGCVTTAPHPHRGQLRDEQDRFIGYVNEQPITASQVIYRWSTLQSRDGEPVYAEAPVLDSTLQEIESTINFIIATELFYQRALARFPADELESRLAENRLELIEKYGGEAAADAELQRRFGMNTDEHATYLRDLRIMEDAFINEFTDGALALQEEAVQREYSQNRSKYPNGREAHEDAIRAELFARALAN